MLHSVGRSPAGDSVPAACRLIQSMIDHFDREFTGDEDLDRARATRDAACRGTARPRTSRSGCRQGPRSLTRTTLRRCAVVTLTLCRTQVGGHRHRIGVEHSPLASAVVNCPVPGDDAFCTEARAGRWQAAQHGQRQQAGRRLRVAAVARRNCAAFMSTGSRSDAEVVRGMTRSNRNPDQVTGYGPKLASRRDDGPPQVPAATERRRPSRARRLILLFQLLRIRRWRTGAPSGGEKPDQQRSAGDRREQPRPAADG